MIAHERFMIAIINKRLAIIKQCGAPEAAWSPSEPCGGEARRGIVAAWHANVGLGFCKSIVTDEVGIRWPVLFTGQDVSAGEGEKNGERLNETMPRLVAELNAQFAESAKVERAIQVNVKGLSYGG